MGTPPEPRPGTVSRRGARRSGTRLSRRTTSSRRTFTSTLRALDDLAAAGARVSVCVEDLDGAAAVVSGDDFVTLPIGGVGVVPLLVEVAAACDEGTLDRLTLIERSGVTPGGVDGTWQHLNAPTLPVTDLAVLAAGGDATAANALIERVGLPAVRTRVEQLGAEPIALIDVFRAQRGPDDAPNAALGSARALARLAAMLVRSEVVTPTVSEQVVEWLGVRHDVSLTASSTGLAAFTQRDDTHGVLLVNKTGRAPGVRAEMGVLAGPRAAAAYALIVCFDDLSITHRLRAHDAFHTLGVELMEYVF